MYMIRDRKRNNDVARFGSGTGPENGLGGEAGGPVLPWRLKGSREEREKERACIIPRADLYYYTMLRVYQRRARCSMRPERGKLFHYKYTSRSRYLLCRLVRAPIDGRCSISNSAGCEKNGAIRLLCFEESVRLYRQWFENFYG